MITLATNVEIRTWSHRAGRVTPLDVQRLTNKVVNAGLTQVRDVLHGSAVTFPSHLAVGTGATAVAAGDTALGTEVFRDTLTSKTSLTLAERYTYYLGTPDANGNTLAEAGLFNAGASGTMFARVVLASTITKTASISVTFTWTITLSAS